MPKVKKKEHENLTPGNIRKVAKLLENAECSKKEACERLRIKYNTTRLNKIILEQQERDERQKRRKEEKRGKPATESEIRGMVEAALEGDPIADIADRFARGPAFVKNILQEHGVPERVKGDAKYKVAYLPDECVAETFEPGEVAWSAIHHAPVVIRHELEGKYESNYSARAYRVWVNEAIKNEGDKTFFVHSTSGGFNANVLAYDLGKLDHIKKLGVRVTQN